MRGLRWRDSCLILFIIAVFISLTSFNYRQPLKRYQLSGFAQGTTWQLSYYASDSVILKSSIDSILLEIDNSMSLYKPNSLISQFNMSVKGIKLDSHFKKVMEKSFSISKETDGVFDVTVKPLVQAWGFGAKASNKTPAAAEIVNALACVGFRKLELKDDSLVKSKSCLEVDLNGIAQGYTVDVLSQFLEMHAINNYLVELGGEIRVKGIKSDGSGFKIGIESPEEHENTSMKKIITLNDGAITTSGNYRQYKTHGNKKVSHLINSRTGYPIDNEMISVTVWARDAITADGFDNVFMNMGMKKSLSFLEGRTDMAAYFIYLKEDKSIADTSSAGFYKFFNN
ncbi:FAD:protein FMN transferase [Paradesertivirga mongoliensis]|uniref:FAD:protein FMN transferase n=1 Tax=Paradesertivirga mongoliensis TaxID=2100740 RepID=A0ABW4ZFJ0_9SPHI|nr:FAD:protein FMN transferase [Pedobacter mongoliensis]